MILDNKATRLFILLSGFFVANALISELIGVKIFSVEKTLGLSPVRISFFGQADLSFNMTAGVITWPVVFIMTDIINEYFGKNGVRFLSYMAAALISFSFFIFYITIQLVPADFWVTSHINVANSLEQQAVVREKVSDFNYAYRIVLGQSTWIIVGSLVAFLIGQIIDVFVFHKIKGITGEDKIWLRATGSTLVSQLIDSFVVLFIAFYVGANWQLSQVFAIGVINYIYKFAVAILITPLLYFVHYLIEQYLGYDLAFRLKSSAFKNS